MDLSKPARKHNSGCLHSLQEYRKGIQELAFVDWFERLGQLSEPGRAEFATRQTMLDLVLQQGAQAMTSDKNSRPTPGMESKP